MVPASDTNPVSAPSENYGPVFLDLEGLGFGVFVGDDPACFWLCPITAPLSFCPFNFCPFEHSLAVPKF